MNGPCCIPCHYEEQPSHSELRCAVNSVLGLVDQVQNDIVCHAVVVLQWMHSMTGIRSSWWDCLSSPSTVWSISKSVFKMTQKLPGNKTLDRRPDEELTYTVQYGCPSRIQINRVTQYPVGSSAVTAHRSLSSSLPTLSLSIMPSMTLGDSLPGWYLQDETTGARAELTLYGATVTAFHPSSNAKNVLFVSPSSKLDGSRPGNDIPLNGEDLRKALDNVIEGRVVQGVQKPSLGCNIKWKS